MTTNDSTYEDRSAPREGAGDRNRGAVIPGGIDVTVSDAVADEPVTYGGARVKVTDDAMPDGVFLGYANADGIVCDADESDDDGSVYAAGHEPDDDVTGVPAGETDEDGNAREHCTCSVCDPGEGETGVVYVEVAPKVDRAKWSAALRKATEQVPQVPLLDEWQLERVAALEHAMRILEARRAAGKSVSSVFGVPFESESRPAVAVQDMINVAAFIAESDTGRTEGEQA